MKTAEAPVDNAPALPRVRFRDARIEMSHGAGGKASRRLIEGLIAPLLGGPLLAPLADAAHLEVDGARLALTADSFVVRPLRFPGGSIGELAVNGTVNDLAVSAAQPLALLLTFVIEEGIATEILEAELRAIAEAARRAGVEIVGGDTKVVEHGKADGLYVTTAGIGRADPRRLAQEASLHWACQGIALSAKKLWMSASKTQPPPIAISPSHSFLIA